MENRIYFYCEQQATRLADNKDEYCKILYDYGIGNRLPLLQPAKDLIKAGKPMDLFNKVYLFRINEELKKGKILPELPRQHMKKNGTTILKYEGVVITKRTFTFDYISLWEYLYQNGDDWIILHHYALKEGGTLPNNVNSTQLQQEQPNVINDNEQNQQDQIVDSQQIYSNNNGSINFQQNVSIDDRSQEEVTEPNYNEDHLNDFLDQCEVSNNTNIKSPNTSNFETHIAQNEDDININQTNLANFIIQNDQIMTDQTVEEDGLLPDIHSSLYYKLLCESIAKKRFFNRPITVNEELLCFRLLSYREHTSEEDDEENYDEEDSNDDSDIDDSQEEIEEIFSFHELTCDGFEFITNRKLVHLTSPAGAGKTVTMWQLAKSINLDYRRKLVPVAIKAEHYYNQIKLEDQFNFQYVSIEALIRSSMHTAEVKNIEDQQLWCQNLEATIKNGTGIVLLIDAVDEMKSRDREEFLKHIHFLTANIPGQIGKINLVALVVSSRPGLTLPTHSEESPWTQLEMLELNDSEAVLRKLCGENRRTFERAKQLCTNFQLPKYIFWYALLIIEAETMDPTQNIANSQFEFLEAMLLRSIKVSKDKKTSLDYDQSAILYEDATFLLHLVGLIAYISKTLGTTRISVLEQDILCLMPDMSFPKSIIESRGSIIKKLLPVLQFCHCCSMCSDDILDKFIVFDHQIIRDYLVADFITKTVSMQTYPSVLAQLNVNPKLTLDWPRLIKDTANFDSEWLQVIHLIADALPLMELITTIKQCDQNEAMTWITAVLKHPRCYDVTDPTFSYIKMVFSCLFNASRKNIRTAKHKAKKSKKSSLRKDDALTQLGFDLLINLFSQPLIGQLIFDEICQFKPLSLLMNELTERNLQHNFIKIFIDKFDATTEQRIPTELVSLAKNFYSIGNPEITSYIQTALFNRLSTRCEMEPIGSSMCKAIQHIFVKIFRDIDYLIEKLKNGNELEEASALPILCSFKCLEYQQFNELTLLITRISQRRNESPMNSFNAIGILGMLLQSEAISWLEMLHACLHLDNLQFSNFSHALRYYNQWFKEKSRLTREVITPGHFNSFPRKNSNTFLVGMFRGEPTSKGFVHADLTDEEYAEFHESVQLAKLCLNLRAEKQSFATLLPLEDEWIPVPFEEYTVKEVFYLLTKLAVQVPKLVGQLSKKDTVLENLLMHRCHFVQLVADNLMAQLQTLIVQITSEDVTQLIKYAMKNVFRLNYGKTYEWYPLINFNALESLFTTLCTKCHSFKWSVESTVYLWKLLGTECYQYYLAEFYHDEIFPSLIEDLIVRWTLEDANQFITVILGIEIKSKLQYEVIQIIARFINTNDNN